MAYIFRPSYTTTDPKTGKKTRKYSRTWWIRYYTPDGARHRVKGYRDKKATEAKAAELERRGIRLDAGMVDPTDQHAKTPLAEHAEDFRRYLAAKGNTPEYVKKTLFRLLAVLDHCRFIKVGDVQASAVVESLSHLRQSKGKSVKTANEYLAAAKGFTRWLWKDRRNTIDPLASLSKLANGTADIRHARRDYSPDELRGLLESTRQSVRPFRRLSGPDRYMIYLTAASTGLRTSELASMTPESFDLDGAMPTAKVQAACTKNRKEAVQPLPLDVAATLRGFLRSKPSGQPVWPGTWSDDASAKMIRRDLAEARAKWLSEAQDAQQRTEREQSDFLAYRDSEGRYADFHALRHGYITMVGKMGVSAREHMDLARHSSYAMTARYSHSRAYDLAAAVQALPIPTIGPQSEPVTLAATGTDGPSAAKNLVLNLVPQPAVSRDFERQTETNDNALTPAKSSGKQAISAVFPGNGANDEKRRGGDSNPR